MIQLLFFCPTEETPSVLGNPFLGLGVLVWPSVVLLVKSEQGVPVEEEVRSKGEGQWRSGPLSVPRCHLECFSFLNLTNRTTFGSLLLITRITRRFRKHLGLSFSVPKIFSSFPHPPATSHIYEAAPRERTDTAGGSIIR